MDNFTNLIFICEQTIFNQRLAQKNALKLTYQTLIGKWNKELTLKYQTLTSDFKLLGQKEQEHSILATFFANNEAAQTLFYQNLAQQSHLIKNSLNFLTSIKGKIKLIAYCKHPQALVQQSVKHNKLEHFFDQIYYADDFDFELPNPQLLKTIINKQKLDVDNTLLIGASLSDEIAAANQLKLACLWLAPKKDKIPITPHPTLKLSKLSDLLFYLNVE